MAYTARPKHPSQQRHDPSSRGIFIHGGTCLMDNSARVCSLGSASPNNFTLTFPLVNGERMASAYDYKAQPTFQRAVSMAKRIREDHPQFRDIPIFACTDLIHEKPWTGKTQVQLVA